MDTFEILRGNYNYICERIAEASQIAGRSPEQITLLIVTKNVPQEFLPFLQRLGINDIGENRVQEALEKSRGFEKAFRWHMVGTLQTNKVKKALTLFDVIHSLDRLRLAEAIQKGCKEIGKTIQAFIQVNISAEETKHGFAPEQVPEFLEIINRAYNNIKVKGLMCMAPFTDNPESVRPYFRRLRQLAERLGINGLSMGMSQDFEVAIQEGATVVRIGTALFKGVGYAASAH